MKIIKKLQGALPFYFLLSLCAGLFFNCEFNNPVEDFNLILDVEVKKEIFSGEISAEATSLPLVPDGTVISSGLRGNFLAKATVMDFIEVPVNIPDMMTFLSILEDETAAGGNFVGTLTNRATNEVTFGVYFSATAGLADPWTDPSAQFVASITLSAAPSETVPADPVIIDGPEDFDNPSDPLAVKANLIAYVQNAVLSNPTAPIIVYLTTSTPGIDPLEEIDVLIENMSFYLPADVEVWNTVTPGDLDNYSDKIEEIISAQMNGSITNTGAVTIRFYAYVYPAAEVFDPFYHRVARVSIGPGSTLIFEDYPDMFDLGNPSVTPPKLSGEQILRDAVGTLQGGNNVTIYLHFYSIDHTTPISAVVNSIELESNVQVVE